MTSSKVRPGKRDDGRPRAQGEEPTRTEISTVVEHVAGDNGLRSLVGLLLAASEPLSFEDLRRGIGPFSSRRIQSVFRYMEAHHVIENSGGAYRLSPAYVLALQNHPAFHEFALGYHKVHNRQKPRFKREDKFHGGTIY